jgi:hypothetical protein
VDTTWPMPDVILYPVAHAALGAASAAAVGGISGIRGKKLGQLAILGGLGGALPDLDHPITGARSFFHGNPSLIAGFIGLATGIILKNKGITAFSVGWCSHLLADNASIGI